MILKNWNYFCNDSKETDRFDFWLVNYFTSPRFYSVMPLFTQLNCNNRRTEVFVIHQTDNQVGID